MVSSSSLARVATAGLTSSTEARKQQKAWAREYFSKWFFVTAPMSRNRQSTATFSTGSVHGNTERKGTSSATKRKQTCHMSSQLHIINRANYEISDKDKVMYYSANISLSTYLCSYIRVSIWIMLNDIVQYLVYVCLQIYKVRSTKSLTGHLLYRCKMHKFI